jgi:hypothetical protein
VPSAYKRAVRVPILAGKYGKSTYAVSLASTSRSNQPQGIEQQLQDCDQRWIAGLPVRPYLHHPATIMLLTCRGFATSRPTVHFFSEKRSMPPIFPFLGAARSGRVPTSTVDSLTFLLMLSW